MKTQKTTSFTLLSEELDSNTLMNLIGGAAANPISSYPHDLITPVSTTEPYTPDDPNEDKD